MKDQFTVTISNFAGSRYFTVRKSFQRYLLFVLLLVMSVIAASIGFNYWQHKQVSVLYGKTERLSLEVLRLDNHNTRLNEVLEAQDRQTRAISRELDEIERTGGIATGDGGHTLGQRVHAVLATISASQKNILHSSIPNGYPTESKTITSKFGYRVHPVTKIRSFHHGVDLRAKGRVNVHATADGIVSAADYSKLSGNRVIVQHNFGFESVYAHLHKMKAKPGDVLLKGDVVGVSGNSGQSIAPHLHYEIRHLGKSVDPADFLQWEFGTHEIFTQVKGVQWPSLISLINKQITHQTLQLSQLEPASPEPSR